MSKPFTYWVRLALVATMCTLVTFSPVSAGRLMDRLLHRDNCKPAKSASKDCWEPAVCESSCLVVSTAPCQAQTACDAAPACVAAPIYAPACGCDAMVPSVVSDAAVVEHPSAVTAVPPAVHHATPDPVVTRPAPVVEKPAPVVEKPAPVVEKPAPVVEKPAPVIEQPAPVVTQPAPVLEQPAPVVEQPKVEKPAPVVVQPAIEAPSPVVQDAVPEKPAVLEEPAVAPGQSAQTAPNPFDAAPAKAPELDIFSEKPAVPTPKEPELDVFGDAVPAVKAPELAVEPAAVEKPAAQPEMPAEAPVKGELDELFGTPEAKPATPETKPAEKVDDIFGADTDPKPALPVENKVPAPEVPAPEVPPPAKTLETELEDLFNDKAVKPVAESVRDEPVGKPVATEVGSAQEPSAEPKTSGADEDRLLESLFGSSPALQPLPEPAIPAIPAIAQPEAVEPEATKPEAAKPEPENVKPEPEAAKPAVDELDALFGVSAFAPPSNFQGAEYRLWVDNSGAYQVKARLAVIYSDRVKLLKENGKYSTVPLSRLSEADFGYVSWVASNLTTDQTARMVKTKSDDGEPAVER